VGVKWEDNKVKITLWIDEENETMAYQLLASAIKKKTLF